MDSFMVNLCWNKWIGLLLILSGWGSGTACPLNQKIVNDIYLSTVARGLFAFSLLQVQQLENLIYQCPLAGGRAVYQARALYSLVNDTLVYHSDSLNCGQMGLSWRKAQVNPSSNDFSIVPNPSSAVTKVVWDNRLYKIASIEVYSLLGIQQCNTMVKENKGEVDINISSLPQGFHVFKLLDEYGNVIKSLKFIKE